MNRRREWERNQNGFAHVGILIGVAITSLVVLALLSLVPAGGAAGWNVSVSVNYVVVGGGIASYYSVTSVSGTTTGSSPVLNWGNSLSVQIFQVNAAYVAKTCVGNECATLSSNTWFPSIPFVNGQSVSASDTFAIGGVPAGHQTITTQLVSNGQVVATGSGSMCVNGSGC